MRRQLPIAVMRSEWACRRLWASRLGTIDRWSKSWFVTVGRELGQADAVIVFDPSGFPKKGAKSVGVARQWLGRLGKVDNGQVGVYMGYASRVEHTLVDTRLYLPQEWTRDKQRCKAAGVPKDEMRFRTRHQLALEMLDEHGEVLPHAWVAGDSEMGRSTCFRRDLADRHEQYLLAVPSNTTIRDLEEKPPKSAGGGGRRKVPFRQVRKWLDQLPKDAWTSIKVRDGDKEPLSVDILSRRVQAKTEKRRVGPQEMLVVIRYQEESGDVKHDYSLSNASAKTSLKEFARVSKQAHCIEESIKRGKSEAGLADYQVRNWLGWHHHQVLSLIAVWFLLLEALRGKKMDTGDHRPSTPRSPVNHDPSRVDVSHAATTYPRARAKTPTQRTRPVLSLQSSKKASAT